jgi:tetratricopeptide (TPR) repeat protein
MANKKDRLTNELSKYVGLGQWAKAVQTLQSLINLEPTNTHYYLRMGDYSLKAGNKPMAIKSYYEAADMYVKAGFSVKAIATYKMILKIAPGETQATALMKSVNTASGGIAFDPSFLEFHQTPKTTLKDSAASEPATENEELDRVQLSEEAVLPVAQPSEEAVLPLAEAVVPNFPSPDRPLPDSLPDRLELVEEPEPSEPVAASSLFSSARPVAVMKLTEKTNIDQLFASFTQEEFGAIVDKLEPLEFMDGERVIAEGDEGDGMYLITKGGGKVVKEHKGQEVELCDLGEGEFFGELSLQAGGLGGASVFAIGETEALRLKSSDLFEMIKQYPRLETVLEQFARAMRTKMRDLPE